MYVCVDVCMCVLFALLLARKSARNHLCDYGRNQNFDHDNLKRQCMCVCVCVCIYVSVNVYVSRWLDEATAIVIMGEIKTLITTT